MSTEDETDEGTFEMDLDDDNDAAGQDEPSEHEAMELPPPAEDSDEDEASTTMTLNAIDLRELARNSRADEAEIASDDEADDFGGPEDESTEQPMLVVGDGSDEHPRLDPVDSGALSSAYEYLDIHTPLAEFESYARARLDTMVRSGDTDNAEVTAAALRLGLDALRRVMGALPKEAGQ